MTRKKGGWSTAATTRRIAVLKYLAKSEVQRTVADIAYACMAEQSSIANDVDTLRGMKLIIVRKRVAEYASYDKTRKAIVKFIQITDAGRAFLLNANDN